MCNVNDVLFVNSIELYHSSYFLLVSCNWLHCFGFAAKIIWQQSIHLIKFKFSCTNHHHSPAVDRSFLLKFLFSCFMFGVRGSFAHLRSGRVKNNMPIQIHGYTNKWPHGGLTILPKHIFWICKPSTLDSNFENNKKFEFIFYGRNKIVIIKQFNIPTINNNEKLIQLIIIQAEWWL